MLVMSLRIIGCNEIEEFIKYINLCVSVYLLVEFMIEVVYYF